MRRVHVSNKPAMVASALLCLAGVAVLVDPQLVQAFSPAGARHGPVLLDGAPAWLMRIYASALLLLGWAIGRRSITTDGPRKATRD